MNYTKVNLDNKTTKYINEIQMYLQVLYTTLYFGEKF